MSYSDCEWDITSSWPIARELASLPAYVMDGVKEGRSVSLTRRMSKVGLLAAMKTFTRPHFQRKKKNKAAIPLRSLFTLFWLLFPFHWRRKEKNSLCHCLYLYIICCEILSLFVFYVFSFFLSLFLALFVFFSFCPLLSFSLLSLCNLFESDSKPKPLKWWMCVARQPK